MVTGVLPLCIGRATRVVEYIQDLPKQYEAELTIGLATDTEDMSGQITGQVDKVEITASALESVIAQFIGIIDQVPPMYSALKIEGKRLYELAREGQVVERKSRQVEIYQIELISSNLELAHPQIKFRVTCSKGTYIRTLCADIGQALGYPAVMSGLVRTATGPIALEQCLTLTELADLAKQGKVHTRVIATDTAIAHIPSWHVSEQEALHALQGKTIYAASTPYSFKTNDELLRLYSPTNSFLGIFRWHAEHNKMTPVKVFN
jgi:tRNA pseudouridine55 synthase